MREAWESAGKHERLRHEVLIIVSHLIGREGGVSVLNQSESEVKQNHLLSLITYVTQLKFVLFHFNTSAALNCTLKLKTAERTLK